MYGDVQETATLWPRVSDALLQMSIWFWQKLHAVRSDMPTHVSSLNIVPRTNPSRSKYSQQRKMKLCNRPDADAGLTEGVFIFCDRYSVNPRYNVVTEE